MQQMLPETAKIAKGLLVARQRPSPALLRNVCAHPL